MMNEENILPNIPTGREMEDIAEQTRFEEIRPYLLSPREDYPEPFYMLEYNGVPFSTLGGIQAISGQKKNGKSFVLTQLMAAILGNGTERVEKFLPGLRVPDRTIEHLGHEPKVLYVDTEMEKLNSAKVLRRVHWLCNWDMKEPNDRMNVLWLRTIEDDDKEKAYEKRFRLIRLAIEILAPDIVFIDGVRDIIGDFNDNTQSAELVLRLMALAEKRGICIWCALHLNPRPGNDDESKMRGHLGTELGNKVTDTLVSIKQKKDGMVSFTVRQQDARGKDMDDWTFEVTDDAGNLGVPRITTIPGITHRVEPEADSVEEITAWINKANEMLDWPMTRGDVKRKVFGDIGGQKNTGRQHADLQVAINLKLLVESTFKVNGYYMLQPPEDMPF
jgi:hypothetical protein